MIDKGTDREKREEKEREEGKRTMRSERLRVVCQDAATRGLEPVGVDSLFVPKPSSYDGRDGSASLTSRLDPDDYRRR